MNIVGLSDSRSSVRRLALSSPFKSCAEAAVTALFASLAAVFLVSFGPRQAVSSYAAVVRLLEIKKETTGTKQKTSYVLNG